MLKLFIMRGHILVDLEILNSLQEPSEDLEDHVFDQLRSF
jgi:hypothetical protein